MSRGLIIGIVLVAATIAVATLTFVGSGDGQGAKIRAAVAESKTITSRVRAQGKLRARRQVEVASEVTGRVAEIFVEQGQEVVVGDPLFRLDDEQLQNAVQQLKVAMRAARATEARTRLMHKEAIRNLGRDTKLKERGLVTGDILAASSARVDLADADRMSAAATVERARLELKRAEESLEKAKVTAPIAGTVVAVNMEVGQVVTGGLPSAGGGLSLGLSGPASTGVNVVVADLSEVVAKLYVDELDVARVQKGQVVNIKTQGNDDEEIKASVDLVGLLGRDIGGAVQFSVEATVREPEQKDEVDPVEGTPQKPRVLRPGMSVTAEIEVETLTDTVAIPIAAVLEGDGRDTADRVFVVDEGALGIVAKETKVTLGPSEEDLIAVLSGLAPGARIVEGPFRELRALNDGDPLVILEKDDDDDKEKKK